MNKKSLNKIQGLYKEIIIDERSKIYNADDTELVKVERTMIKTCKKKYINAGLLIDSSFNLS